MCFVMIHHARMNMRINKIIAQEEMKFLEGIPKVNRYYDKLEKKYIDVVRCDNVPQKGVKSCASIGLNGVDIGLVSNEKSLRIEIVGACDIKNEYWENIIATVAFEIMDARKSFPGYIVKNVINQYITDCEMKHVLLTNPFLWDKMKSIYIEDICLTWLLVVPISENEYRFAQKKGVYLLEDLFEQKQIDIYNIFRKSVI